MNTTDKMTNFTNIEVRSHALHTDNQPYAEPTIGAYASSYSRPVHFDQI